MIGDNPIEFMTYLQKKLPGANYSETDSEEVNLVKSSPRETKRRNVA